MTRSLRRISFSAVLLATLAAPPLLATPAGAETTALPADFSQRKAVHIRIEQQEINILTESLGCIGLATDEASIKACLTKRRQQDDALRAQTKP